MGKVMFSQVCVRPPGGGGGGQVRTGRYASCVHAGEFLVVEWNSLRPGGPAHGSTFTEFSQLIRCISKQRRYVSTALNLPARARAANRRHGYTLNRRYGYYTRVCVCRRKKYTMEDDMKIIKFILDNNWYSQVGGNVVWKNLDSAKVRELVLPGGRERGVEEPGRSEGTKSFDGPTLLCSVSKRTGGTSFERPHL